MITYQTELGVSSASRLHKILSRYDDLMNITEMEREGATVFLERKGDEYVVKVRVPGKRQIRTGSTSGYPIQHAFEKWRDSQ